MTITIQTMFEKKHWEGDVLAKKLQQMQYKQKHQQFQKRSKKIMHGLITKIGLTIGNSTKDQEARDGKIT